MIAKAPARNAQTRYRPTREQVEVLALAAVNAAQEARGLPPYDDLRYIARAQRNVFMRHLHAAIANVNGFLLSDDA